MFRRKLAGLMLACLGAVAVGAAPADPPTATATPLDRHGDPLPPGALLRLGTVRLRHSSPVNAVAFSPDGKSLLSSSRYGTIRWWDPVTGQERRRLATTAPTSLVLAPDGKTLAAAIDTYWICLWDARTGRQLRYFRADTEALEGITVLAFSPDGKTLASAGDKLGVRLWEAATGKELRHLENSGDRQYRSNVGGEDPWTTTLAFSPDGRSLFQGTDPGRSKRKEQVRVWDRETGKLLREFEGNAVPSLSVAPDGKSVALATTEGEIHLWDMATWKLLRRLPGHVGEVCQAAFSPDEKTLASCGMDETVRLWDPATGRELSVLRGHEGPVWCLGFSSDGRTVASGSGDTTIRLWEVATGQERFAPVSPTTEVSCLAFAPDGKTLATADGKTVRLWEVSTGRQVRTLTGHEKTVRDIAFTPDGRWLVSGGEDEDALVWDVRTGKEVRRLRTGGSTQLLLSPDGSRLARNVAGSAYGPFLVALHDAGTGKELHQFRVLLDHPGSMAFSPDGQLFAAGGPVRLWDVAMGKEVRQLPDDTLNTKLVQFSPDGKTLTTLSSNGTVAAWDVASGKRKSQGEALRSKGWMVWRLARSPDSKTVALVELQEDKYQDTREQPRPPGEEKFHMPIHLFDAATGKEIRCLDGHHGGVNRLAFSPDGKLLASAGDDATVLLWDLASTGKGLGRWQPPPSPAVEDLWADLARPNAAPAHRAISDLAAVPGQALPLLAGRLRPARVDGRRIERLLSDLDGEQFAVRQAAFAELEELAELAKAPLRKLLADRPSVEVRRQVGTLLERLDGRLLTPRRLREVRAVEVLERIGDREACRLLAALAQGAPEGRLTLEAKAALERLGGRSQAP